MQGPRARITLERRHVSPPINEARAACPAVPHDAVLEALARVTSGDERMSSAQGSQYSLASGGFIPAFIVGAASATSCDGSNVHGLNIARTSA